MTVKPWIARIYPERHSSLYVRVQVWPTKAAMLAYLNEHHITLHGNRFGGRTQAACAGIQRTSYRGKHARKHPCVAEVNFWRGRLGIGVITHELFHATMRWGTRIGFNFNALNTLGMTMEEERITYAHGNLCRQFMEKGMRPGGVYTERDTVQRA
jgi:hypothetical protein